jgi:tetratricopeptide (TPR) repeat protein
MIIDPDRNGRSFFQRLLESMGYSIVATLENNDGAIEQMLQRQTQLLIINWHSTPTPGMVFLQKVRQSPKLRFIPTIIISKVVSGPELRLATELGLQTILQADGDPAAAKQAITRLVEAEEKLDQDDLNLRTAAALVEDGKIEMARPLLEQCNKAKPNAPAASRLLGELLVALNDWTSAKAVVEPAHLANPKDVHLAQMLAKIYSRTNRQAEAVQILERLSERSPLNIETLLGLGSAYEQSGETDKAKQAFEGASSLDPDNPEASSGLGRIAVGSGAYQEALKHFKDPRASFEIVRIFNNCGIGAMHKGDVGRAVECYRAALSLLAQNPEIFRVRYNLGLALRSKGELEGAFATLADCVDSPIAEKAYASLRRVAEDLAKAGKPVDQATLKRAADKVKALRKAG